MLAVAIICETAITVHLLGANECCSFVMGFTSKNQPNKKIDVNPLYAMRISTFLICQQVISITGKELAKIKISNDELSLSLLSTTSQFTFSASPHPHSKPLTSNFTAIHCETGRMSERISHI